MKIEIVVNTRTHKEHKKIAGILNRIVGEKGYEIIIIDMGAEMPEHEKSRRIKQEWPHLIITCDMAGFELRNTLGYATYRVMPYRMAHILPGEYALYGERLQEPMNFSMFFFASSVTAKEIKKNHPETENVYPVDTFSGPKWWDDDKKVRELVDTIIRVTEIELDF